MGKNIQKNSGGYYTITTITLTKHNSKHPFPTTQEKTLRMDIIRWSTLKSD